MEGLLGRQLRDYHNILGDKISGQTLRRQKKTVKTKEKDDEEYDHLPEEIADNLKKAGNFAEIFLEYYEDLYNVEKKKKPKVPWVNEQEKPKKM